MPPSEADLHYSGTLINDLQQQVRDAEKKLAAKIQEVSNHCDWETPESRSGACDGQLCTATAEGSCHGCDMQLCRRHRIQSSGLTYCPDCWRKQD